ncbi:endonuclease VII domain-containing protein [Hyphomicrobium sp. DY-1]|uniref:endonuclease VII domain-containing protein n=1 Tax=Hyphomicrobium sp. DY-1 TaxID=3075650 RepID=UPI0039C36197
MDRKAKKREWTRAKRAAEKRGERFTSRKVDLRTPEEHAADTRKRKREWMSAKRKALPAKPVKRVAGKELEAEMLAGLLRGKAAKVLVHTHGRGNSRVAVYKPEYEALHKRQNGCCAICGRKPEKRSLVVDHEHGTGVVRGLICYHCNTGLGMFGDDPSRILSALNYLLTH